MIKKLFKKIVSRKKRLELRELQRAFKWYLHGKKDLPPASIKRHVLKKYAKKYKPRVFVETGTAGGDTVQAMSNFFDKIISIEIYEPLARAAKQKFKDSKHIEIVHGNSGEILESVIDTINEPILFWLDGHYSGDGTGKGSLETPIIKELETIFKHSVKDHIILIDDYRCFDGTNDYPKIEDLKDFISKYRPEASVYMKHDILFII